MLNWRAVWTDVFEGVNLIMDLLISMSSRYEVAVNNISLMNIYWSELIVDQAILFTPCECQIIGLPAKDMLFWWTLGQSLDR